MGEWQTLFTVRPSYDGAVLDCCAQWPRVEAAGNALKAALVAARLEGKSEKDQQKVMADQFPEAWEVANYYRSIELRVRLGHSEGPYLITSAHKPTDEELLEWWKANREKKFRL